MSNSKKQKFNLRMDGEEEEAMGWGEQDETKETLLNEYGEPLTEEGKAVAN